MFFLVKRRERSTARRRTAQDGAAQHSTGTYLISGNRTIAPRVVVGSSSISLAVHRNGSLLQAVAVSVTRAVCVH